MKDGLTSAEKRAVKLGVFIERVSKSVVFRRHKGRCGICHYPVNPRRFTLDHIKPLSKGGTHEYANIQPAHEECNRLKADLLLHQLLELAQPAHATSNRKLRYRNNGKRRKRPRNR